MTMEWALSQEIKVDGINRGSDSSVPDVGVLAGLSTSTLASCL